MGSEHLWCKSSQSANNQSCVEVRGTLDAVRDSKNVDGSALLGNVRALLRAVQDGRFDR